MTGDDFVRGVEKSVIDQNSKIYQRIFETTERGAVRDEHWRRALALFDALTPEQRRVLAAIVRQVQVDTVSSMLAILDGSYLMEGQDEALTLQTASGALSGDLQNELLRRVEQAGG